jgi:hypothetical protein
MAEKEIGMQRVYTASFSQEDIDRLLIEAAKERLRRTYGESYRTPEGARHGIVKPTHDGGFEVAVAVEEAARGADVLPMASNAKR